MKCSLEQTIRRDRLLCDLVCPLAHSSLLTRAEMVCLNANLFRVRGGTRQTQDPISLQGIHLWPFLLSFQYVQCGAHTDLGAQASWLPTRGCSLCPGPE